MSSLDELRKEIVELGRFLVERDLTVGSHGNISARLSGQNTILITPSFVDFYDIDARDLVLVDMDGNVIEGDRRPSSELKLHLSIYKNRPDVNAVIHAHTVYASAFAVARKPIIPYLDELLIYVGGEVAVAEYALPGTQELADNAVKALGDRNAVLLANHGLVVCGDDLRRALKVLLHVERAARVNILSAIIGGPVELPEEAIEFGLRLFKEFSGRG